MMLLLCVCVCVCVHVCVCVCVRVCKVPIWGTDGSTPDDASLPVLPDNGQVVDMLLCIQEVQKGQAALFDQGLLVCKGTPHSEQLLAASKQAALACSELSVRLLSMIKGLSFDNQELAVTVQSLSYNIAQAGKSLSHLVKCGPTPRTATSIETCYSDPSIV